jgi:hypothetical protein
MEGILRYWFQRLGWGTLGWLLVVSASAAYLLTTSPTAWGYWVGVAGVGAEVALVLVFLLMPLQMWRQARERATTWTWTLEEEGLSLASSLGTSQIPWHTIDGLRRSPRLWLFLYQKTFFLIPTAVLDSEARDFIVAQLQRHKVKVS